MASLWVISAVDDGHSMACVIVAGDDGTAERSGALARLLGTCVHGVVVRVVDSQTTDTAETGLDALAIAIVADRSHFDLKQVITLFQPETPQKAEKRFARIAYSASPRDRTYRNPLVSGLEIRRHLPRRV